MRSGCARAYHFMFGPSYEAGCPVCSSAADTFSGAVLHLRARDVTFLCISRAPLDRPLADRQRMGWQFPWVSSTDDFSFDYGILDRGPYGRNEGERPEPWMRRHDEY